MKAYRPSKEGRGKKREREMKTRWVDDGVECCLLLRRGQETRIPTTLRNRSPPSTLRHGIFNIDLSPEKLTAVACHFMHLFSPIILPASASNTQKEFKKHSEGALLFCKRARPCPRALPSFERSQESLFTDQIGAAGDFSLSSRHLRFSCLPSVHTRPTAACFSRLTLTIPCEDNSTRLRRVLCTTLGRRSC